MGWLFDLPQFPDGDFFNYNSSKLINIETRTTHYHYRLIDQNILYQLCPYLDEIKTYLQSSDGSNSNSLTIKHITPVSATFVQSTRNNNNNVIVNRQLIVKQQLEEAFFNGQSISMRKTVDFVSEQIASVCVKFLLNSVVFDFKKSIVEQFAKKRDQIDDQIESKTRINRFVVDALKQLKELCESEAKRICNDTISVSIQSLLGYDVLKQTKDVCVLIAMKRANERVEQWIQSHVTTS